MRQQVLRAATRLFAAHGFDATPIQAVADAVGVSKPSVLHHFASKEELRRAVLDNILAHWNEVIPRLLLATTAAEDRFDALSGALVAFFLEDRDRARLLVREALDRPDETRAMLSRTVRPWITAVAEYIRRGQRGGAHWEDVDPEAYVLMVMQSMIVSVSALGVTAAALGDAATEATRLELEQRLLRESLRIARAALFRRSPPAHDPPATETAEKSRKRAR